MANAYRKAMTQTRTLGPESGKIFLKTTRAGVAKKAGHDLTIEAQRWSGDAVVDVDDPAASSVNVDVEVDGLTVLEGTGGVKPLGRLEKGEIHRNIQRKILHSGKHPVISFRSTAVSGTPESFQAEGQLTIVGQSQPVTLHGTLAGGRVTGTASVVQSRWGIKPFTAFLGALKLNDEVSVEFDVSVD